MFRPIVHCSRNECFSFHKIRKNIVVYINYKRIIQNFWSILNLLHLLTSYLFNKKNSGLAGEFKIVYLPSISKEPRGAFRIMEFRPCQASKIRHFGNRVNNHSLFFEKRSILDTQQGSELASETYSIIRYDS